jgi:hypothetical protein
MDGGPLSNLSTFLERLDDLGLVVSQQAAESLGLRDKCYELEQAAGEARLTDDDAEFLRQNVRKLRLTLDSELLQKKAFVVSPKRWDVDKLLTEPSALFAPELYASLESIPQFDFAEACRCIAFERPTAAAFHLMRGTEAVLRTYYCRVVRQKRLSEKDRTWGAMVEALRKRSKPPPKALLDELDNIRFNYRNPTQHPDATYDIHGAQDLLGLCIAVVNQIAAEEAA